MSSDDPSVTTLETGNTQGTPLDVGNTQGTPLSGDGFVPANHPAAPPPPPLEQPVIHTQSSAPADTSEPLVPGTAPMIHDLYAQARDQGYSWTDIDSHLAITRENAASYGYTDQEMDQHLGYSDPKPALDRFTDGFSQQLFNDSGAADNLGEATKPYEEPPITLDNPNMRDDYARALLSGEVKGPVDFVQHYGTAFSAAADAGDNPVAQDNITKAAKALAPQLPDIKTVTDVALGVAANTSGVHEDTRQMPGPGFIPGDLHIDPSVAPKVPEGAARPFGPGEFIRNPDGSTSNEISMTVEGDPTFNGGKPTNIPGLWLKDGKPYVAHGEDEAIDMAKASGLSFATFGTLDEANAAAEAREQSHQNSSENLAAVPQLWSQPVDTIRRNIMEEWATSGEDPMGQYNRSLADPDFARHLATDNDALTDRVDHVVESLGRIEQAARGGAWANWSDIAGEARDPRPALAAAAKGFLTGDWSDLVEKGKGEAAEDIKTVLDANRDLGGMMAAARENAGPLGLVNSYAVGASVVLGNLVGGAINLGGRVGGTAIMPLIAGGHQLLSEMFDDKAAAHVSDLPSTPEESVDMAGHFVNEVLLPMGLEFARATAQFDIKSIRDAIPAPDIGLVDPLKPPGEALRTGSVKELIPHATDLPPIEPTLPGEVAKPVPSLGQRLKEALATPAESLQTIARDTGTTRITINGVSQSIEELARQNGADPETIQLAKGYDIAGAIYQTFRGVMADESGAVPLPNIYSAAQNIIDGGPGDARRNYVQALIRQQSGLSDQIIAKAFNDLDGFRGTVEDHMPGYLKQLKLGPAGNLNGDPIYEMNKFISGRSTGAQLDPNSPLYPVANALREVYQTMEAKIRAVYPDFNKKGSPGWVGVGGLQEDYLRNNWKRPGDYDKMVGSGKQGSTGGALKKVTLGYVKGIEKGLEPKFPNPIDNALQYVQSMSAHLAARTVLDTSAGIAAVKYYPGGKGAPESWVPLDGQMTTKAFPIFKNGKAVGAGVQQAHAPKAFATSYNNWVSKGKLFGDGPTYQRILYAANAMRGIKLLVPTYHAMAMASETSIASIAHGLGEFGRGNVGEGIKHVLFGASVVPSLLDVTARGIRNQREYLSKLGSDTSTLFAMAGGRIGGSTGHQNPVGRQDIYRFGAAPSILKSIQDRSLGREFGEDVAHVIGSPDENRAVRAAMFAPRLVGFAGKEMGRVLNTINGGLFDHVVPWLKQGAFGNEMDAWLKANPTAEGTAALKYARTLVDSMDNRFGELNQNNLFWKATMKQVANLFLVSTGWEYGSLRAFGNAAGWDVDHMRPAWNPVAFRWMLGFLAGTSIQNSIYQYAKTGTFPWQTNTPLMDFAIPRNGSKHPDASPGRTVMPGYNKDVFAATKAIMTAGTDPFKGLMNASVLVENKLSPFWQMMNTLRSGQDAIGHNIREMPIPDGHGNLRKPTLGFWDSMHNYFQHVFKPAFEPIAAEQFANRQKDTGLSPAEMALGFRDANSFLSDQPKYQAGQAKYEKRLEAVEKARMEKENAALANPDPSIPAPGGKVALPPAFRTPGSSLNTRGGMPKAFLPDKPEREATPRVVVSPSSIFGSRVSRSYAPPSNPYAPTTAHPYGARGRRREQ